MEAHFRWLHGSWGRDGQGAKRVPSRVPISSSFERCWSHWPCRSSLSQGQYSPSTAGGARHPQTAPRIPQGDKWRREWREEREQRAELSILAACESVLPFDYTGIQVCCPKEARQAGDKGTSKGWAEGTKVFTKERRANFPRVVWGLKAAKQSSSHTDNGISSDSNGVSFPVAAAKGTHSL